MNPKPKTLHPMLPGSRSPANPRTDSSGLEDVLRRQHPRRRQFRLPAAACASRPRGHGLSRFRLPVQRRTRRWRSGRLEPSSARRERQLPPAAKPSIPGRQIQRARRVRAVSPRHVAAFQRAVVGHRPGTGPGQWGAARGRSVRRRFGLCRRRLQHGGRSSQSQPLHRQRRPPVWRAPSNSALQEHRQQLVQGHSAWQVAAQWMLTGEDASSPRHPC